MNITFSDGWDKRTTTRPLIFKAALGISGGNEHESSVLRVNAITAKARPILEFDTTHTKTPTRSSQEFAQTPLT